ncbi:hydrolase, partial [Arthrospira sp. O9.13F]
MPMMINDNILPPKLIVLDAVGALFGVRESVGD